MPLRESLIDTFVHMPPLSILEGLEPGQALLKPSDGIHSVAELLAHIEFWQVWLLDRCDGVDAPMAEQAVRGWPPVTADNWPGLVARFGATLQRAAALAEDVDRLDTPITPAIQFPPLAAYTVRDALVHIAQHNSHHLGQIVLVRQLIGQWPPPSGSWTW